MTQNPADGRRSRQQHPWYRYPWPWVAIGIPAIAVAGGLFTLYLAMTHPDPLVVDADRYQDIRSGLQAEPAGEGASPAEHAAREVGDGAN